MSAIYITLDAKTGQVEIRGRGQVTTYPTNGHLTASASAVSDAIDIKVPGGAFAFYALPRDLMKDGITNLKFGVDVSSAVTNLNTNYFNANLALDLDELNDVSSAGALANDALVYDGAGWTTGKPWAEDVGDLDDVSTAGVTSGDGLKYNGSSFVAGKWGLGEENQTIPANDIDGAVGTTFRTITLDTETNFPSRIASITTLDVVDNAGSLLERIQMTTTDVGAGDVSTASQEKYGQLLMRPDNYGTDPEIKFFPSYSGSAQSASIAKPTAPNQSYRWIMPDDPGSAGQVLTIDSVGAGDVELKFATPSGGGGSSIYTFTDAGRRQWSSTQDNHYNVGDSNVGIFDTSETYCVSAMSGTGNADLFAFNGFPMPADIGSEITITGHANTFSSHAFGEDVEIEIWKVSLTSGDDCTVTSLGSQTFTLGSASGDMSSYQLSITSSLPVRGEMLLPTFRFPSIVSGSTTYLRYGFTLTAS